VAGGGSRHYLEEVSLSNSYIWKNGDGSTPFFQIPGFRRKKLPQGGAND
jgi:hypothetical protein